MASKSPTSISMDRLQIWLSESGALTREHTATMSQGCSSVVSRARRPPRPSVDTIAKNETALLRQGLEHRLPGIGPLKAGRRGLRVGDDRGRRLKARSLELIGWGPGWPFAAHGVSGRPGKRVAGPPIRTP